MLGYWKISNSLPEADEEQKERENKEEARNEEVNNEEKMKRDTLKRKRKDQVGTGRGVRSTGCNAWAPNLVNVLKHRVGGASLEGKLAVSVVCSVLTIAGRLSGA